MIRRRAKSLSGHETSSHCLVMKHIERHHSRYTPAQLFDLVADVERYPDFVPWVVAARVYGRRDSTLLVEMTMGTSFLHKRFTATALLDRPHRVDVNSHDPAFERFEHIWTFEPAAEGDMVQGRRR